MGKEKPATEHGWCAKGHSDQETETVVLTVDGAMLDITQAPLAQCLLTGMDRELYYAK